MSNAVATGAFQEKTGSSPPESVLSLDVQSSSSSLSRRVKELSKKTVMSDIESPKTSKAKRKATRNHTTMQAEQGSNEIRAAGVTYAPAIPTKVPRFAAFLAALSQPRRLLEDALSARHLYRARKILKDPATSRLIDKQTLNNCLDWAIWKTSDEACALLIDAGADISDGRLYHPQLVIAATIGGRHIVAFLLDRGADVNYQSGDGTEYSSALRAAIIKADEAMITLLSQKGADLNAVQSIGYPTGTHEASARNSLAIVDLLINLGADINSPQRHYGTPLMLSIYKGCFTTAELLIKRGANITEVNVPLVDPKRLFYSAMHIAIYVSAPYLVRCLLRNGVGTDLREAFDFAAQHNAWLSRQLEPGGAFYDVVESNYYARAQIPRQLMREMFDWETRNRVELMADANEVLKLIREHNQRSAEQA